MRGLGFRVSGLVLAFRFGAIDRSGVVRFRKVFFVMGARGFWKGCLNNGT